MIRTRGTSTDMQVNSRAGKPNPGTAGGVLTRQSDPARMRQFVASGWALLLGASARAARRPTTVANSSVAVPSSTMVTSDSFVTLMITWMTPEYGSPTTNRCTPLSSPANARTLRAAVIPPSLGSCQETGWPASRARVIIDRSWSSRDAALGASTAILTPASPPRCANSMTLSSVQGFHQCQRIVFWSGIEGHDTAARSA
jgi:hypothetical protein